MDAHILHQLLREQAEESRWEDLWCRTYCVGVYASIPESHREWIRRNNPWFLG